MSLEKSQNLLCPIYIVVLVACQARSFRCIAAGKVVAASDNLIQDHFYAGSSIRETGYLDG
jgi:hypothetical protein